MTKSLDAPSKSFGCAFLHFSSAFYLVSRSILPRKLEQFGCPVNFLAWLTDYLPTEISAQDMEKTNLPCCWIFPESFKELVVCHYLFSTYISDPRASSLGNCWNMPVILLSVNLHLELKTSSNFPTICLSVTIFLFALTWIFICQSVWNVCLSFLGLLTRLTLISLL